MALCASCRTALRKALFPPSRVSRPSRCFISSSSASSSSPAKASIQELFSKPTSSIQNLLKSSSSPNDSSSPPTEKITPKQLHHLLRLSALPLPTSQSEEDSMLDTLQQQLHFVRELQKVDTSGVEPLRVIRDETAQGVKEITIGLEDVKGMLDQEEKIGFYQRPRRRREKGIGKEEENEAENWDALGMATRKSGRYFVVESGKRGGE